MEPLAVRFRTYSQWDKPQVVNIYESVRQEPVYRRNPISFAMTWVLTWFLKNQKK